MKTLVVTRHSALVAYLLEQNIITEGNYTVMQHVTVEDIKGKDVVGVIPLWMVNHVATITSVTMTIPKELYGKDLTLEEMRPFINGTSTYTSQKKKLYGSHVFNIAVSPYKNLETLVDPAYYYAEDFYYYNEPVKYVDRATPSDVEGKDVLTSEMPLHLACLATSIVVAIIDLPFDLRGKVLSQEEMKKHYKGYEFFSVEKVDE